MLKNLTLALLLLVPGIIYADAWEDRVSELVNFHEKLEKSPELNQIYSKFSNRIKNLFLTREISYLQVEATETGKKKSLIDIYYKKGQLYILQQPDGWNLITHKDYVYEWESGKDTGIKIKKNPTDLVDYITYITDPSSIIGYVYKKYLENPANFKVSESSHKQCKEYSPLGGLKTTYGISKLWVDDTKTWLCGLERIPPKSGKNYSVYYSHPKSLSKIPSGIKQLPKEVKFTDSESTLRRHMVYL